MPPTNTGDLLGPEASDLNGLSVMVVEDSWQVSSALQSLLEACGAEVIGPVATAADAVRLTSERTADVALVDIKLRDGEMAYALIDRLQHQGIRVVVMTGYDDLPSKQGKAAAVLRKPVQAKALLYARSGHRQ